MTKDGAVKDKQQFVICNLCTMKYEKVCDLERHIKSVHKEHDKFECGKCEKSFVTKWRLKKHVKMHFKLHLRECHYYKSKTYCPFDKLGCKLVHGTNKQVIVKC